MPRRLAVLLIMLLAAATQLHAQMRVSMQIPRRLYVVYEPLLVNVAITNMSGHDVLLSDSDGQKWFSFQVNAGDGRIIPPLDLDYHLQPLTVPAGATVKRSLNLSSLYSVQEFGLYRVKASVYSTEMQKYFSSTASEFEITDGKVIWQQTVGVPAGQQGSGSNRTISLLVHRREKDNMLYVRVEDKDAGLVYCTSPLGHMILTIDPQIELDKSNMLHVLQFVGPKTYVYTKINLQGDWVTQLTYNAIHSRPNLKKHADGTITVAGGQLDVPVPASAPNEPKLSDRPPGMPKM